MEQSLATTAGSRPGPALQEAATAPAGGMALAERLAAEDLAAGDVTRLAAEVTRLRRTIDALEAQWLRRVAHLERAAVHETEGHPSMKSWLVEHCGVGWGRAACYVEVSQALEHMPRTAAALAQGELGLNRVRQLVDAYRAHREAFVADETRVVDMARNGPPRRLRRELQCWKQRLDFEASLEERNVLFARRHMSIYRQFGGMVRTDGELDPEGGTVVLTAMRAVTDNANRDPLDGRTYDQKNADALADICRFYLDNADTSLTGGERPHLTVTVDLNAIRDNSGGGQFDDGEAVHPETARRLLCDAAVSRIIVQGESEPLDVGRRTRTIPPSLRRALVARDGGCIFYFCDTPPRWCDAHHVIHWADGGETSLDNLVLLCRRHHRAVHEGGRALPDPPDP